MYILSHWAVKCYMNATFQVKILVLLSCHGNKIRTSLSVFKGTCSKKVEAARDSGCGFTTLLVKSFTRYGDGHYLQK